MEVILLEKIYRLGGIGAKVNVKAGYGRNYLIPQGKALPATEANKVVFEKRRAELERVEAEKVAAANARKAVLDQVSLVIEVRAGDEGKLFGSVGVVDIVDAMTVLGHQVDRSEVRLPHGPIRQLGDVAVELDLGSDVVAIVNVSVQSDRPLEDIAKPKAQETKEGFGEFDDFE